jgi:PhnB protein
MSHLLYAEDPTSLQGEAYMVNPIPAGYRTVNPYLTVRNGVQALDFYKKAFGAEEIARMLMPDGKLMHAEFKIGDTMVMMSDEFETGGCKSPETVGAATSSLMLYVEDTDASYKRAVDAGAKSTMAPQDMFWGDRFCQVVDPFGQVWSIATHIEDVSPEEMEKRTAAFAQSMGQG